MLRAVARAIRRPEAALFAACFAAYAYFYQAGGWNQNTRFDLTRAVVERHTASIDAYRTNTGDLALRNGHFYCDKAPGLSWLAVPAYATAHALFAPRVGRPGGSRAAAPGFLAGAAWVSTVWAVGLPSALSVVALALLLGALGLSLRARLALAAAYGLATLAWPYSTLFYGHQLCAALTLGALAVLVRARRGVGGGGAGSGAGIGAGAGAISPLALLSTGVLLGFAVVVEYPAALAVLPIVAYAALFVRPWRRLGWLVLGGAIPGLALALYHGLVFGGPLAFPYDFSTQHNRSQGFFMGLGWPSREALAGIAISSYRGLLFSAPWLALALPGAVRLWLWRREHGALRAEAITCGVIVLLYLWLNASLVDWQGGWAMGPRYLVPCIPFLVVLAAGVALPGGSTHVRRLGWLVGAAAALHAAYLMLAGTAVRPEVPVVERHPFGHYILPAFARGQLAINTQSIDSAGAPPYGARAAWNLGQRLGLRGLASLAPLGVLLAGCLLWLSWAVRGRERALAVARAPPGG